MNKKKLIPCATIILSLLIILLPLVGLLAAGEGSLGDRLKTFAGGAGYAEATETTFASVLGMIVTALLSFLGIIFFLIIFYGGFTWMTAGGDEEKIKKAKNLLKDGAIGLAIVLMVYVIYFFIYEAIGEATLVGPSAPKGIGG